MGLETAIIGTIHGIDSAMYRRTILDVVIRHCGSPAGVSCVKCTGHVGKCAVCMGPGSSITGPRAAQPKAKITQINQPNPPTSPYLNRTLNAYMERCELFDDITLFKLSLNMGIKYGLIQFGWMRRSRRSIPTTYITDDSQRLPNPDNLGAICSSLTTIECQSIVWSSKCNSTACNALA
jgi:hypothetical protein